MVRLAWICHFVAASLTSLSSVLEGSVTVEDVLNSAVLQRRLALLLHLRLSFRWSVLPKSRVCVHSHTSAKTAQVFECGKGMTRQC